MNLKEHPIYRRFYDLLIEIEKLGASIELSDATFKILEAQRMVYEHLKTNK